MLAIGYVIRHSFKNSFIFKLSYISMSFYSYAYTTLYVIEFYNLRKKRYRQAKHACRIKSHPFNGA